MNKNFGDVSSKFLSILLYFKSARNGGKPQNLFFSYKTESHIRIARLAVNFLEV